ncbi:DUF1501 domain-containing protein [Tabrizicola fusiformis]|uniref:DUF1501 domain-containing protein n=1 Tax=Tabrizicola sp. SY72 TaxID=2741673 RepID=UPI001574948C|nr:DUF1501 domain-containing protein [Tabrizicola sp. SY72]NTT84776.1 DUF1501 domain-containing protein [Tabrizicola sp. SY72]
MIARRQLLRGAAAFACSAAAHPFLTTVTLAGSDGGNPLGDHRLVVIILRGAMDGLDVVLPKGDADFARLRPTLNRPDALDLDGFFAMNAGLGGLMPLWQAGQLGFVQAVATPYRDKRSHFSGQDQLEAGTGMDVPLTQVRDGWLNRMLQAVPGLRAETAYAVGREELRVLAGAAPVHEWAPETLLELSPQAALLLEQVYHDDPLFLAAASEAIELGAPEMMEDMAGAGGLKGVKLDDVDKLVRFAAGRLREETRIAAFSLSGWDTHKSQARGMGRALMRLERAILQLQQGLGADVWGKTTVLAMTEFGRTAAENGSGGTDHGTGGAMLVAGGAVRGGRVFGDWPGLAEAALYQRRDLMPTSDVRAWAAHAMQGMYGFDRAVLEGAVFPGLQMGGNPGLIL